ncbi:hypothetical protein TELCIR_01817 [Teladorsagia circumcincta]|uniref:Uncharacterized protein n=1 Tax=Teladorsagia circumcincta TaxID=45464 RepID=A0A2G9V0S9_TELCI|nr:hypothetical protein TELCIR_01817 [Teladorsagia circumcincta]
MDQDGERPDPPINTPITRRPECSKRRYSCIYGRKRECEMNVGEIGNQRKFKGMEAAGHQHNMFTAKRHDKRAELDRRSVDDDFSNCFLSPVQCDKDQYGDLVGLCITYATKPLHSLQFPEKRQPYEAGPVQRYENGLEVSTLARQAVYRTRWAIFQEPRAKDEIRPKN